MGGLPDALFVIDVKRESIAVSEASKMGIPIIGVVDSNSSPEKVDYVIPGNDDATRSIILFSRAVSDACLEGSKLATGLKPNLDSEGPKIIKKEENKKEEKNNKESKKKDKEISELEEVSKQEKNKNETVSKETSEIDQEEKEKPKDQEE